MQIGNKINIHYKDGIIISFLEELILDNQILIQIPYVYKDEALLNEKETYNITIFTKDKIVDCIVKVVGYKTTKRRKYYILKIEQSFYKDFEKRKYERYFCNLQYKISLLDDNKEEDINVIIKDISLGGIRFLTNGKIENNLGLKIKILFDDDYFIADSQIIQAQYYPKANYKNQYRIKFDNIENEHLIKNYFEDKVDDKLSFTLR